MIVCNWTVFSGEAVSADFAAERFARLESCEAASGSAADL